jgi:hypothetical protein
MQCSTCRREAIIFQPYSGRYLCGDHLIQDLEAKAKRAIRVHHGMQPGDHIGVVMTGDSASAALQFFLKKLTGKRKDIRVSVITADEATGHGETGRGPGITKIAGATTLEDAAASALTAILMGDAERCFGPGSADRNRIPVITPFSHIPAEEIALYARLCGVEEATGARGTGGEPLISEVKAVLGDYSTRHPAAPHAILNLCESLGPEGRHNKN